MEPPPRLELLIILECDSPLSEYILVNTPDWNRFDLPDYGSCLPDPQKMNDPNVGAMITPATLLCGETTRLL